MSTGKKKMNEVAVEISLSDYNKKHHVHADCTGSFKVGIVLDSVYSGSALGPVRISAMPVIFCKECEVEYMPPKFADWLDGAIAINLIKSNKMLSKKQIKFLRLNFDLTQDELGEKLDLSKSDLAKMESEKFERHMSADKQFRMKFLFAKMLEIEKLDDLSGEIVEEKINTEEVMPSKQEILDTFPYKKVS